MFTSLFRDTKPFRRIYQYFGYIIMKYIYYEKVDKYKTNSKQNP